MAYSAVPTFESLGLYWSPTGGSSAVQATVRYKAANDTVWNNAQDLWFAPAENGRVAEYRGSIVGLRPGTTYDVELDLAGATPPEYYQATTWSENFPIAQTIVVSDSSTPLEISGVNGSPAGYILYTGPATIDVNNTAAYNIRVQNSSYVIIRGLTLVGAQRDGILLGSSQSSNSSSVHDIVIEGNDISNWGTVHPSAPAGTNWGYDDDSAIRSSSTVLERITVQRNKLHHPRTDSNSWKESNPIIGSYHPNGPQGITFEYGTKGNFVIRYNEIYSDTDHRFNDGMGADQNFGYGGFPVKDSDVYGNYVAYTWDDGLEIEGANMNVRVWGNYTDETYTGVAMSGTTMGPLYVFRNVFQHSRTGPAHAYGGGAFKRGGSASYPSNGRQYIFNNTLYYTTSPTFQTGIGERTDADFSTNTIGRNNILRVRDAAGDKSVYNRDTGSSFDYDLYNGEITTVNPTDEANGISGLPTYVTGAGLNLTTMHGIFQLTSSSLGYDGGAVIPNFTDGYDGAAPDIGAHEANKGAMQFGVSAYSAITWDGPTSGTWDTAANWTGDNIPDTAEEDAHINANANQATTVTRTMAIGAVANVGSLTIDSGDALTVNKVTTNGSASMTVNKALLNSGTLTLGGSSASTAHGHSFTFSVLGGSDFNSATGVIDARSLTSYRRSSTLIQIPASNTNAGQLVVQNTSTQGGGKIRFSLTGSGTFTNSGTVSVEGRGSDNSAGTGYGSWAVFGPGTSGASLTLAGSGSLMLASNLGDRLDSYAMLTGIASGTSLTNASTIIGRGYIGYAGTNGGSGNTITVYSFTTITNTGLIRAERHTNLSTLYVAASGGAITNSATGRLVAAGTAGTVLKLGSDSTAGTFTNSGTLEARSGTTVVFGTMLAPSLGGVVRGGGTISASTVALSAATLEPGNSTNGDGTGASTVGMLSVSGNLTCTGSTVHKFQLGATSTRGTAYDAVTVSGNLTLDGTLDVENRTGFGVGTYRLFTFAAGGLTNNGLTLGTLPGGYNYSIIADNAAGTVDLVVTSGGSLMAAPSQSDESAAMAMADASTTTSLLGSAAADPLVGGGDEGLLAR